MNAPAFALSIAQYSHGESLVAGACRPTIDLSQRPKSERNQRHGKAANALRTVDKNTFNIRGRRWTSHQHRVSRCLEPPITICLMPILNDRVRIEQDYEVLSEVGQRIYL
jgi:hypothetical protein